MDTKETLIQPTQPELRRDVPIWGSFMWGFADVGANTFVALGLVMAYGQGASALVLGLAGLLYMLIGFAYTELASAYPVSGGGPYYTLRSLGDFGGSIAGSGLLLAYTIDIALFAAAASGYLNFFMPGVLGVDIDSFKTGLGPFKHFNPVWCLETMALIFLLIWLNIRGVRESSALNEVIGVLIIIAESSLVVFGFMFAWKPELLLSQWVDQFPTGQNLLLGISLAIISFVGLESISQAAQETKRPATVIPRTSLSLIFSVFIFAVAYSTLGLGILPWQEFAANVDNPLAVLASSMPLIGFLAGPIIAAIGALVLFISSNTGIMGASRLTYSLSQYGIIDPWFDEIHPRYKTPVRTIWIFSLLGILATFLSFLTPAVLETLAKMYAFGATLGYTLVFVALMKLRFSDPYSPRPYRMPLNLPLKIKGIRYQFPVLALLGAVAVAIILVQVVWSHKVGRFAGPGWVLLSLIYYVWFRRKNGYPIFKSLKRDWEKEQIEVLTSAEEYDLLEQYKAALSHKKKQENHEPKKPERGW